MVFSNGEVFLRVIPKKAFYDTSQILCVSPDESDPYAPGPTQVILSTYFSEDLSPFMPEKDIAEAIPASK